ncbi:prepilin peptidase [Spirillospora sp. CA-255316]
MDTPTNDTPGDADTAPNAASSPDGTASAGDAPDAGDAPGAGEALGDEDASSAGGAPGAEGSSWSWRAGWTEPLRRRPIPVVLAAVAVTGLLVWRIGVRPDLPAFLVLGVVGTALATVDIASKRLPDPLTLPLYGAGLALLGAAVPATDDGGARFLYALTGLAGLWLLFAVQWFAVPGKIGLGDVKLAGVLGMYLGWLGYGAWMLGVLAMFVLAGVFAAALLALRRAGRGTELPYGPFMLAGALAGALVHAG